MQRWKFFTSSSLMCKWDNWRQQGGVLLVWFLKGAGAMLNPSIGGETREFALNKVRCASFWFILVMSCCCVGEYGGDSLSLPNKVHSFSCGV